MNVQNLATFDVKAMFDMIKLSYFPLIVMNIPAPDGSLSSLFYIVSQSIVKSVVNVPSKLKTYPAIYLDDYSNLS